MSFAYHGNWCGPGWTAGQYKDAKEATFEDFDVPAVDELDKICKTHDMSLFLAQNEKEKKLADQQFIEDIINAELPGIKDNIAGFLVWALGPGANIRGSFEGTSFNNFPCHDEV